MVNHLITEWSHCWNRYWLNGNTYLEVKAFGVISTGCGDEWFAGDVSVAWWADDARLWEVLAFDGRLRSDNRSFKPTVTAASVTTAYDISFRQHLQHTRLNIWTQLWPVARTVGFCWSGNATHKIRVYLKYRFLLHWLEQCWLQTGCTTVRQKWTTVQQDKTANKPTCTL